MTCPEFVDLLSARIDGDLSASQRVRLDAHLESCDPCRRTAAQTERAVAWLRGLERLPAPSPASRLAHLPRRRTVWGALRPVALAASAVLAALLAWEGFDTLVAPTRPGSAPAEAPAGRMATGGDPAPSGRIAETPSLPPREMESPAAHAPGSAAAVPGPWRAAPPPLQPPTPGGGSGVPRDAADDERVYARIHGSPAASADGDPGANDADAASPAIADPREPAPDLERASPATTAWIVHPVAPAPAPAAAAPPAAASGRGANPTRTSVAPPAAAPSRPEPTEVASSVPVTAWVDDDEIHFGDAGEAEPGELRRRDAGNPATEAASLPDLVRRADEIPRPDADPRTGVTPPVPLERPRTVLPTAPDPEVWRLLPALSLQVTIAADGRVVGVAALPWPGPAWVAESLTKAVRGWTFLPAELAGAAIASRVEVAIEFDAR